MTIYRSPSCRPIFQMLSIAWIASLGGCQPATAPLQLEAKKTFGHRQLEQVLDDRPDMVGVVSDDNPIVAWVIGGFNGERTGQRIYWNAMSPRSAQPAEHWPQYFDYPPQICISGGTELTAIDKWTGLVYEFFNLENSKSFEELGAKARGGELDGDGYARGCTKLEFEALRKAKAFFQQHPLPPSSHGEDPYYQWVQSSPDDFEAFVEITSASRGYNPLKYFHGYFDESIAPFIAAPAQQSPPAVEAGTVQSSAAASATDDKD